MLQVIAMIILSAVGILSYQDGSYAVACFDFALVGLNLGMLIAKPRSF